MNYISVQLITIKSFQIILDSLLQIGYLEGQERKRCGWPSRCTQILRDAQSAILEGALERLQERGSSASAQTVGKPKTSASLLATSKYTFILIFLGTK
jgi:hypothetical protein